MNYDDVIEAALKQGDSVEQIAAAFSKALNKREKELRDFNDEREDFWKDCREVLDEALDQDLPYSFEELRATAGLIAYEMMPRWPADRLRKYADYIAEKAEETLLTWEGEDCHKETCSCNKSKEVEKVRESAAPIGNSSVKKIDPHKITDEELKRDYPYVYKLLSDILKI